MGYGNRSTTASSGGAKIGRNSFACAFEPLEGRRLLSVGAEVELGLSYAPTGNYGDTVHRQHVAADANGNLLSVRQDGAGEKIYAHWRNSDLAPLGAEFVVATRSGDSYGVALPQVDVAPDGTAVIAWSENKSNGYSVFAKVLAGPGDSSGKSVTVVTGKGKTSAHGAVPAISAGGSFAVAWELNESNWPNDSVRLQRFDSSGRKLGKIVEVSGEEEGAHASPAMDMDAAGNSVVIFPLYSGGWEIWGRRYDSSGVQIGGRFHVGNRFLESDQTVSRQTGARVSMAPSGGDFVVAWDGAAGLDDSGATIYGAAARPFDVSGASFTGLGEIFLGELTSSAAAGYAADGASFALSWLYKHEGDIQPFTDDGGSGDEIIRTSAARAQSFFADGTQRSSAETIREAQGRTWAYGTAGNYGTVHNDGEAIDAVNLAYLGMSATGQERYAVVYHLTDLNAEPDERLQYGAVWTVDDLLVASP